MEQMRHTAMTLLDDTDMSLKGLESTVRLAAMGLAESSAGPMAEELLLHIADSLQGIRAQLDEATAAAAQAMKGAAA